MEVSIFEPVIGRIYIYKDFVPHGPFLLKVVEYPVMPEDHGFSEYNSVVKMESLTDSDGFIVDLLENFCYYFREATQTEITLYT